MHSKDQPYPPPTGRSSQPPPLLSVAVHSRQLAQQVARIAEQQAANELRRAILDAVSHDLRTPLSSIKAAVTGLREPGSDLSDQVTDESLALIEEEADRLNALVGNLLDMSRIQAGTVTLACSPHGPGIPAERRQQLLEPFRRVGNRSRGAGVGLGLAVAKGFVDAMDGRLALEDTPGGGLTVAVSLKAAS